jgi:hypothetical protein
MTDTGGFAFLIAWALFFALCLGLAYLILRRPRRDRDPAQRSEGPDQSRADRPPGRGSG